MSLEDRSAWYRAAVGAHDRALGSEQAQFLYAGDAPMPQHCGPTDRARVRAAQAVLEARGEWPGDVVQTKFRGPVVMFLRKGGEIVELDTGRKPEAPGGMFAPPPPPLL